MKGSDENILFCDRQVLRFAGTDYWAMMTPTAIKELSTALCVSADSQADAEQMVTARLLLDNERPTPAYFAQVAQDRKREARAQVPWKPDTQPSDGRKCRGCEGWGCVKVNGKWEFCPCAAGRDLRVNLPGYIDFCNSLRDQPKNGMRRAAIVPGKTPAGDEGDERKEPNSAVFAMPAKKEAS